MAVDDSYTKVLLHMNGADASASFTDESGKTWTPSGSAQIDTAESKFGGASGLFEGTSDYISTPNTTDFEFGTGDFTIDFWAKINSTGTLKTIFMLDGQYGTTYPDIGITSESMTSIKVDVYTGSTLQVSITKTVTTGIFNHIALIRNGSNFYLAINGVLGSAATYAGAIDYYSATPVHIGIQPTRDDRSFVGWLDEFRISKGIARWTANFTPPSNAYSRGGNPAAITPYMMI